MAGSPILSVNFTKSKGVRAYGHVVTKVSRMGRLPHFLSYGAPPRRARAGGAPLLAKRQDIPFDGMAQ